MQEKNINKNEEISCIFQVIFMLFLLVHTTFDFSIFLDAARLKIVSYFYF